MDDRRQPHDATGWISLCPVVAALALLPCTPSPALAQTAAGSTGAPPAAGAKAPEGAVGGMGDVNIYPKRIVLDGRQRLGTLGLYNRSTSPGDYDISVTDKLMGTDGSLVDLASVADPAARARVRSAASLVRWSPRRVTLGGSEAQTVRIMLRLPPGLPDGEYRSHFSIISLPPIDEGLSIDAAAGAAPAGGIGVRIVPRYGISVPVIVRVGETTLIVSLRNPQLIDGPQGKAIALTIGREGTRSAFGDIAITPPGSKTRVAEVMGVGVYTEVGERKVLVPINPKADPRLYQRGAKLVITYIDDDAAPGKELARQEFVVP